MQIKSKLSRRLATLVAVPSSVALAAGAAAAFFVYGPMTTPAQAEPVSDCLDLVDGSLFNSCPFTVEAVWCVENFDCNGGRFSNMATIPSLTSHLVHGGRSGNMVHWGACRGVNTISHRDTPANSWTFYCDDD